MTIVMENNTKSQYKYTKGEMEVNRAFKMQEMELAELGQSTQNLSKSISNTTSDISQTAEELTELNQKIQQLRESAFAIAEAKGVTIPEHLKNINAAVFPEEKAIDRSSLLSEEKISKDEIPSWTEIMAKVDNVVPDEVNLEDLLSNEEFQYCIEDVRRINNEFAEKTRLCKVDIAFLMVATALQTARWIIIQQLMGDLGETVNTDERIKSEDGDKQKKKDTYEWNNKHSDNENIDSEKGYPTWKDIIFGQYRRIDGMGKSSGVCPYDAQTDAPLGFDDGGRGNHRVHTLGHDPILGWIFGTGNIMTCTITLSKKHAFATHRVLYPGGRFGDQIPMLLMFKEMYESICEDKFRLAAGLFAQYAHLKSDVFTSRGLPVPLIEVFSKELAGKLYSEQYDALCLVRDMKIVGSQAVISIIINMIIGFVHGLFYNAEKDGNREHYEVRTRKILLYSNAISTSLNLAYVGVNAYSGNASEAWKKLDLGGLLVTLYRLFSDIRFITKIKEQFIQEEMDKVTRNSLEELDSMFK